MKLAQPTLFIPCLLSTFFSFSLSASPIYQCKGPNNRTVFSDQPCEGEGQEIEVRDYKIGGAVGRDAGGRMYESEGHSDDLKTSDDSYKKESSCVFISSTELRRLKIRHSLKKGMKSKDVRGSWGSPSDINNYSKGRSQWVYYVTGGVRYVYLKDGCVTSWRTAFDRK
ncbi:DUF4124 domain-containing protein [Litoribrevibacter albus]|uniref:DUF4124 domain-containing protein n=1 Tax=Litoribrevibacter albus TaxID=1473156 RepID=A0AA37S834_9GAMM|nr:DUF4124 domain-containing protein [Litoribrevibacter albus]GLQ29971.1 hypothetical protein GCM10007876_04490 [Litoribrevibacter albus]